MALDGCQSSHRIRVCVRFDVGRGSPYDENAEELAWFPIPWSFPPGKGHDFQFHGPFLWERVMVSNSMVLSFPAYFFAPFFSSGFAGTTCTSCKVRKSPS